MHHIGYKYVSMAKPINLYWNKYIMILTLQENQTHHPRYPMPPSAGLPPLIWRGWGEPGRRSPSIWISDAYISQYEHSNQKTRTEDQGRQHVGPPELVGDVQVGISITGAAKKLGMSQPWGSKWWARYEKHGFAGLEDRLRSGRPSKVAKDKIDVGVT